MFSKTETGPILMKTKIVDKIARNQCICCTQNKVLHFILGVIAAY